MSAAVPNQARVVVAGLGKTGVSCVRYLLKQGVAVSVTDSRRDPPGLGELRALAAPIDVRVGGFDLSLLDGASQLLMSPGISLREPIATRARAQGIEILGDIELFARAVRAPVIGITGTNGKSTVTSLVAAMALAAGRRVLAGGNLGDPALDLLARDRPDLYVLELSSFQLETTHSLQLVGGVVLNVTSDHLDRYASMADYASAKARIFAHARTAVLNIDDPWVDALRAQIPAAGSPHTLTYSIEGEAADFTLVKRDGALHLARRGETVLALSRMRLTGLHNASNALAALALGEAAGLELAPMLQALQSFAGLPHRSQWVADIAGVRYIDDSKGTNVGATLAAVAGMPGPLVMIAGGDGKGQDFTPLASGFRGKVRSAVLIGKDADALQQALAGVCPTVRAQTLPAAVAVAARSAVCGDTVLLSPACASLDMFRDYAQRGDVFAAAVRALATDAVGAADTAAPPGERQ
jgi:UDP-N-acetylmuramoylalanine--D-glutamate ligase